MDRPHLQYRKPILLDHERVLQEATIKEKVDNIPNIPVASACSLDDEGCVSCSG